MKVDRRPLQDPQGEVIDIWREGRGKRKSVDLKSGVWE
jgi:hypothetical protein